MSVFHILWLLEGGRGYVFVSISIIASDTVYPLATFDGKALETKAVLLCGAASVNFLQLLLQVSVNYVQRALGTVCG